MNDSQYKMFIIIWSDISFPFVRLQLAYQKKRPPPTYPHSPLFQIALNCLGRILKKKYNLRYI